MGLFEVGRHGCEALCCCGDDTERSGKFGTKKLPGLCHGSICLLLNKLDIRLHVSLNNNILTRKMFASLKPEGYHQLHSSLIHFVVNSFFVKLNTVAGSSSTFSL